MTVEELKTIKCGECSGQLVKSYRIERDDDEEIRIPIAKCQNCGKVYDQYTQEYYEVFADDLTRDKDYTVFKLGAKGVLNEVEYEIIGRIRYQEEDEYEKSTWDEWFAVSSDGTYHYFSEEEGKVYSYEEYIPESIDLEASSSYFEFEGTHISKANGYNGRIVYSEGELPWEPEIGEPMLCYDFKHGGDHFTIEQSEDEVSITRGVRVPFEEIVAAFGSEEHKKLFVSTMKKRKEYTGKARLYLFAFIMFFCMNIYSCFWSKPVNDVMKNGLLVSNNITIPDNPGTYFSQAIYGPFEINNSNSLYDISFSINERIQKMNNEWQSFRMLLIHEDKLNNIIKDKTSGAELKQVLDTIDTYKEPVESYMLSGDFWDESGYDGDGYWHENDLTVSDDFVIEDSGKYYAYLEVLNNKKRRIDSVFISIIQVKPYRYYLLSFIIMILLFLINKSKAKSYNELPFRVG